MTEPWVKPKVPYGPEIPPSMSSSAGKGVKTKGKSKGTGKSKGKSFSNLLDGIEEVILRDGEAGSWKRPKQFDEVEVHVIGKIAVAEGLQTRAASELAADMNALEEAAPFLTSRADDEQPLRFILGSGDAPACGLDSAIATMRLGQISLFTMSPDHAYGVAGLLGKDGDIVVPPGASVTFEVELINWTIRDDLFNNGKAVKSVLVEGSSWQKPQAGDEVRISYVARSQTDDDVLAEFYDREYELGSGLASPVMLGLTLERALSLMKRGEKAIVDCQAGQAFPQEEGPVSLDIELHEICEVNDVSLKRDGSMMKKRLRQGEGHERPKDGQKVSLCVEAVTAGIIDGESLAQCPRSCELVSGNGDVCDALELLVLDMQRGERARLTCRDTAAELCADDGLKVDLGLSRRSGGLPTVIIFQVELCDFETADEHYSLDEDGKLKLAEARKDVGNTLFRQRRYALAIERYKRVIEILKFIDSFADDRKRKALDTRRSAELNKAACGLHLREWELTIAACNNVLKEDALNVKALFRRGSARVGMRDFNGATEDLRRCLELEPNNSETKKMLRQAAQEQKAEDQESKGFFSKMCTGLGSGRGDAEEKNKENTSPSDRNSVTKPSAWTDPPTTNLREIQADACSSAGPSTAESQSTNSHPIAPGARVRVAGLIARTELNGQEGHVVAWDTHERRWRVKLSAGRGLCLKPENIVVLPPDAPSQQRVQYGPPPPPRE